MRTIPCTAALLGLALLTACERAPSDAVDYGQDAIDPAYPDQQDQGVRIVSLAPALTRMLIDMDQGDRIVGVAQHDDAALPGLPVVGSYLEVNGEALINLRPTHVVMMTDQHGVPEALRNYAASIGFKLAAFDYPFAVRDVLNILRGSADTPDQPSLGAMFGLEARAHLMAVRILMQLGAINRVTDHAPRANVLMIIGVEPQVMASAPGGTGMVLDDLLGFAGGLNVAADAKVTAPTYDRETLLQLQPQVILLLLPGDPPITNPQTDARLAPFRGLDIPAVRDRRIALINDPLIVLPGTNIAATTALLAKAINPQLADRIDQVMQADPADLAGATTRHAAP